MLAWLVVSAITMTVLGTQARGKPVAAAGTIENRCGWFVNPSPGNASLIDRDGEWTIAVQGGHQADGDWPPPIRESQWVSYGVGSYGYGCACLRVQTDREQMQIKRIVSSQGKPLSQCRRDRALTEPRD
ncbi:MAG: DUF4087 domain-containing protein [Lysobacter sp.]